MIPRQWPFRILIDIDGVVANLVGAAVRALRLRGHAIHENDFIDCDFHKFLTPEQHDIVYGAMSEEGFCLRLEGYSGSRAFLATLRRIGEVVAVTRPFSLSRTWAWERTAWLQGHCPVISTDRKDCIEGDVFIEDTPDNLTSWLDAHPHGMGILIDRPWNRVADLHPRAHRAIGYTRALAIVLMSQCPGGDK